ncbi:histidinol-phosphate transaminase [Brevibacterium daeguense]|uniref:Histidinol-phosphate aminotransferase n=1 Tax=Brevibacterium daeguense TaxID=909936 RepID=A0ABP8EKZ1_9MICO|nr:histidinol-phosphate transaminase [Brevibacterium daeguense]
MTEKFAVRPALSTTPAYIPGKPPAAVEGIESYKLSSNENHLPPLPGVVEAAARAAGTPSHYPDPAAVALTEQLANHLGVPAERILFSAGASEMLASLARITLEAGTEVVYPWPSFEMYPQVTALAGATQHAVALTADFRHDLDAMAAAITESTRLVLLCSPNNPTGSVIRRAEFDAFMARVPSRVLVVLDEAYWEFGTDPEAVDGLAAQRTHPNLVVVRTFSKAHGLAGLRIGFAVADPEIILELRKAVLPFSVTAMAQAAARESLSRVSEVEVRAKEIAGLRDELISGLREQGWQVPESHGNYVWLPLTAGAADFEAQALAAGVAVRNLKDGVRISVGPEAAMSRVLEVAGRFRAAVER